MAREHESENKIQDVETDARDEFGIVKCRNSKIDQLP